MAAQIYSKGTTGTEFSTKLENINDRSSPQPQPLANYSRLYIMFRRPDGIELQKKAYLRDPDKPADTDIVYVNTPDDDILGQTGYWEYWPKVEYLDNTEIASYDRISFWVV